MWMDINQRLIKNLKHLMGMYAYRGERMIINIRKGIFYETMDRQKQTHVSSCVR